MGSARRFGPRDDTPGPLGELLEAVGKLEAEHVTELRAIREQLERLAKPPAVYTIAQFAEVCSTSQRTVRRAIDAGDIPVVTLGDRTILIPASALAGKVRRPAPLEGDAR